MPVEARLDWVLRQLRSGRVGHVVVGAAQDPEKLKVKVMLHPDGVGAMSAATRFGMESVLTNIRAMASQHIAMDRGHKHTSGLSEVAI